MGAWGVPPIFLEIALITLNVSSFVHNALKKSLTPQIFTPSSEPAYKSWDVGPMRIQKIPKGFCMILEILKKSSKICKIF